MKAGEVDVDDPMVGNLEDGCTQVHAATDECALAAGGDISGEEEGHAANG